MASTGQKLKAVLFLGTIYYLILLPKIEIHCLYLNMALILTSIAITPKKKTGYNKLFYIFLYANFV
jgi:hypothetical protein